MKEKKHSFFALISRMKHITRWSLMRNNEKENVQEHSHVTAVIAHALAVISRDIYGKSIDPGQAAAAALFHDATEIFTGDMPTPVKYSNAGISAAYKNIEVMAAHKLLATLPEPLRKTYAPLLLGLNCETAKIVKAADTMSAYIKCLEELKSGNTEFCKAAEQTLIKLGALAMPEVDYFLSNFIPAFGQTLDELDFTIEKTEEQ